MIMKFSPRFKLVLFNLVLICLMSSYGFSQVNSNRHTCGKRADVSEPIWVDTNPNSNPNSKSIFSSNNKTAFTNITAYTQSIHNVIAKWNNGSCESFSFGTTPGGNNIRWGQGLSNTAKHTGGHSYEELRITAAAMGTAFNIGDVFYLSLNVGGALDTAFQLQFVWEDLGNSANVVTINVETNYGDGGAPYTAAEATKLMAFYNLVNPIIKEVYGPPSRSHTINIINDANAVGSNTYYNGPNQVSSNSNGYLNADNDLDQPRLMIHELIHGYRDNVGLSSNSEWHYEPVLSGFEEGMAEGVAIIVMDIFIDRYPNFFNGDEHKIHWNQAQGMPFEWDYDFQNHTQITTQDYWSSDQATGSHVLRYGLGATAMKKMYYEDSLIFINFNDEYYQRMNTDHTLLPTRALMVDIFKAIKTEVERTPMEDWINDQRIFDCSVNLGKKVFMLSYTSLGWQSFQQDNRIHFMETHQNGLEWNWGSTDQLGANEVENNATWGWTHQLNNTPGDIDFIRDWNNTSFRNRSIINDSHWVTDVGGPNAGAVLSGPYQGANPYNSFDGLTYDVAGPWTRDLEQDQAYSTGTEMGKRAFAVGSQNIYTSTSTAATMWPQLASIGGPIVDNRVELNMNESGLYRFEIGFNDVSGPRVEDSYFRLLGDNFIDAVGVFGGIYSTIDNQINGRMFIEHEDFGEELDMTIFNNSFIAGRTWTSVLEPEVKFQGGRVPNDMEYSVPGQVHAIYLDPTCAKKKIDFRTIGYGDGLEGTQMLLFNVEEMEDIIFTQSNDMVINVGDNFNLDVTNNFPDILNDDSRINYSWVDPNSNSISTDTNYTFMNAATSDSGVYNVQINFLGCPVFSLPVKVTILNPLPIELVSFNATLQSDKRVKLDWTTINEVNNDFFTVEKSIDAKNWEKVNSTSGAGNSITTINYVDFDNQPFKGVSYYRLKQTDFNGDYVYSEIRVIELKKELELRVYPNPATESFTVELSLLEDAEIKITNELGQIIKTKKLNDFNRITFDSSSMSSGIYFIQVISNDSVFLEKIIIE